MKKSSTKKTLEQTQRLEKMWESGVSSKVIQIELGLNASAISHHIRRHGILRPYKIGSRTNLIINDQGEGQCLKCNKFQNLVEFTISRGCIMATCRLCRNKMSYLNHLSSIDNWIAGRLLKYKHANKKLSIDGDLDIAYIKWLYDEQDGLCFYSGCKLFWGGNKSIEQKRFSTSLDKVIPSRGYIKGNVVLAQNRINSAKSDFSLEEIKKWMPEWYEKLFECKWLNITELQ